MATVMRTVLLGLWLCAGAHVNDIESLVQQSLGPHVSSSLVVSSFLQRLLANRSLGQSRMEAARHDLSKKVMDRSILGHFVSAARTAVQPQEVMLARGWSSFVQKATAGGSSKPEVLLKHAKSALLETGAFTEMQKAARSSFASFQKTEGAVPLDSMMVGFRTSLAPWNNVLKEFSLPLIKASFTLFANFFGPEGNAARLCVSAAIITDSTYGVHSRWEFGGINIWAGPAKWDNVPGWNFGAGGGIDDVAYFDVSDFGWKWTLSTEPETLCFFFDICVVDSEGLHRKVSAALQTDVQVTSSSDSSEITIHGSTWIEHVWCSPDWENTPLVIEDGTGRPSGGAAATPRLIDSSDDAGILKNEEWDPDTEPV